MDPLQDSMVFLLANVQELSTLNLSACSSPDSAAHCTRRLPGHLSLPRPAVTLQWLNVTMLLAFPPFAPSCPRPLLTGAVAKETVHTSGHPSTLGQFILLCAPLTFGCAQGFDTRRPVTVLLCRGCGATSTTCSVSASVYTQ